MSERAGDRLDGEAEIVGDVLPRHRQLDNLVGRSRAGHLEEEACDSLLGRFAAEEHHVLLRAAQALRRRGPEAGGNIAVARTQGDDGTALGDPYRAIA